MINDGLADTPFPDVPAAHGVWKNAITGVCGDGVHTLRAVEADEKGRR